MMHDLKNDIDDMRTMAPAWDLSCEHNNTTDACNRYIINCTAYAV